MKKNAGYTEDKHFNSRLKNHGINLIILGRKTKNHSLFILSTTTKPLV